MIRLSNLIQNIIISSLYNNIKFTLRHKLEKKYQPIFIFNNDYYKQISKYSFVCKHWFNYIRSLFNSFSIRTHCWGRINKYNFNIEYSFFQYNNIINLYLVVDEDFRDGKQIIIDYINKFSNLERLILVTDSIKLVKDITTRYPTLKLELDIFERYDIVRNFSLLESISEQSIDFIHVTVATNTLDEDKKQQLLDYKRYYKRVNSIFFFEDQDHDLDEDFPGTSSHLSHSDIITNKSLQYITIDDDIFYTHNLINVVKDNDHIISFRASLPLFVFGNLEDDLVEKCSNFNNANDLFLSDNKLEHWIEFCEHLANTRTLKSLHISNSCRDCDHYLSEEIQQQVIENFCMALESNHSLEYLTIPCGILKESFYNKFSDINQTIYDIHFECTHNHLELIGDMMKINKTIKTLGLSFNDKYDNIDQQQSSIESFVNGLRHNQTLKTLIFWDRDNRFYKALIMNYKQLNFKIKVSEQFIKP